MNAEDDAGGGTDVAGARTSFMVVFTPESDFGCLRHRCGRSPSKGLAKLHSFLMSVVVGVGVGVDAGEGEGVAKGAGKSAGEGTGINQDDGI